jgi:hypothetical protein
MSEKLKNRSRSTLSASIDNTQTSISVADGSQFPSSGRFRIRIDDELLVVTARSGNTLTVERGAEGTTAASHLVGATVSHVLTYEGLRSYLRNNIYYVNSGRPSLSEMTDTSGNLLSKTDFTAVNQGSRTYDDQLGGLIITQPSHGASDNWFLLTRSAPSTPYSVIAATRGIAVNTNSTAALYWGIGFRESGTGKFTQTILGISTNNGGLRLLNQNWNSPTSFSATNLTSSLLINSDIQWLKIRDDGTNLIFYLGNDGLNWIEIYSVGRTNFMTGGPNQVFVISQHFNSQHTGYVTVLHWSEISG